MITYTEHASPLGSLLLAATDDGLCGVYFEQHKYFDGPQGWRRDERHAVLRMAVAQLDEYFNGRRCDFDLPLDLKGTPFQVDVWKELARLSFGGTSSYRDIAERIGKPLAVRATGTAIGRNPVSIIVPCHRVLGSSGKLSGYAGGLDRKRYLLAHESRGAMVGTRRDWAWANDAS